MKTSFKKAWYWYYLYRVPLSRTIYDVYRKPSLAKTRAWSKYSDIIDATVITYNCQGFTVAYVKDGKFIVHTPTHTYEHDVIQLESKYDSGF